MYSREVVGYLIKVLKFEKKIKHYEKIYHIGKKQFRVIAKIKNDDITFFIKNVDICSSDDIRKIDHLRTKLKSEFRELSEYRLTEKIYGYKINSK